MFDITSVAREGRTDDAVTDEKCRGVLCDSLRVAKRPLTFAPSAMDDELASALKAGDEAEEEDKKRRKSLKRTRSLSHSQSFR